MNPVDIAEPMHSRWSPSVFDDAHQLTDAEITRLLEAAQWAPSSGNRQPWRYVVAPRGSAAHAVLVPHLSRGNSGWVPRASVVFLSTVVLGTDGDELKDLLIPAHDVGQASAHLTLQAEAMGSRPTSSGDSTTPRSRPAWACPTTPGSSPASPSASAATPPTSPSATPSATTGSATAVPSPTPCTTTGGATPGRGSRRPGRPPPRPSAAKPPARCVPAAAPSPPSSSSPCW